MMRLDKFLADMSVGTRAEVKKLIRSGNVKVDDKVAKDPNEKIDETTQCISCNGKTIVYHKYEYYMMNKPSGVISATTDSKERTVLDLISTKSRKDLFPVGRLDKDTEGLLLITNDGALAHCLLSPKKHVDKVYYAKVEGVVTEEDVLRFSEGIPIGQGEYAKPSKLKIIHSGIISEIELTIQEGKFHQVKRMFEAVGKKVVYLKRLSMGTLQLDSQLKPGEFRKLTNEELEGLC